MNRITVFTTTIAAALLALLPFALLAQNTSSPLQYPDKSKLLVYLDKDGIERPVKTPADWQIRRKHILENMQLVMGPLPDVTKKVPLDVKVEEEEKTDKYTRQLITFATDKNDRVSAYLFIPKDIKDKTPGVLCLHPTEKNLGKKVVAGLGGKANRQYAVELAERGYVTIAPDYVGMGGYNYDPYANGYASATMKGIWNHMIAVDLLQSLPEVDKENIGAIGHSLGGHNSMFVAVFDERIKCIVSSCGFNSFPTYYKGNIAGWSHNGYMPLLKTKYDLDPKKVPFDFPEVVAALAPRAFLACAPLHDSNFEVQGVKDCIVAARPVYQLLAAEARLAATYPDAGHDFPDPTRKMAYEWMDRWLKGK
jgi:hypothetical protein